MPKFTLHAVRVVQYGIEMFLVSIPIETLVQLKIEIEKFDPLLKDAALNKQIDKESYCERQGYQREHEKNRSNRFGRFVAKQDVAGSNTEHLAISPTTLQINDRKKHCQWNEKDKTLTIDSDFTLYIVDGQHRKHGFDLAIQLKPELAGKYHVPVMLTYGLAKEKEIEQFVNINSLHRGVKTILATELKTDMKMLFEDSESSITVKDEALICNIALHLIATKHDSPWFEKIAYANAKKMTKKERIEQDMQHKLGQSSFNSSLKPIYKLLNTFGWPGANTINEKAEKIAKIICEYWSAIRELMPEPFLSPDEYYLQKSTGCLALNEVLPAILVMMHQGRRLPEKDQFIVMLQESDWYTSAERWCERGDVSAYQGTGEGRSGIAKLVEDIKKEINEAHKMAI